MESTPAWGLGDLGPCPSPLGDFSSLSLAISSTCVVHPSGTSERGSITVWLGTQVLESGSLLILNSCVTLGNLLNLAEPWFLHL